jgi:putative peptide zinc metalloprotease protein
MAPLPKLRSDLVSSPSVQDGATVYTVKDPVAGKYIRLREPEFWLATQLDGKSDTESLAARFREKFGFAMAADDVTEFSGLLDRLGFLEPSLGEQAVSRPLRSLGPEPTLAQRILFIKLGVLKPKRLLDRLAPAYRPFHNSFWFFVQVLIMVIGVAVLLAHRSAFTVDPISLFSVGSIITVITALFLFIAFHEMAHAVVCRHYGGEVREMGFLLLYFQPCFYADVSDAWLFPNKRHRLAVTLAGLWSQTIVMALAVIVWRVTVEGTTINQLSRMVGIVCWITLLFNFNPLIKLDGYYLLSDWLEIPNLRAKAFGYLKNVMQRRLFGWPVERVEVTPRERKIFLFYAVLSFAFSLFLIGYFVLLAARLSMAAAGTPGLILFLCLLAVILRTTAQKLGGGIVQHLKYMKSLLKRPVRLFSYVVVFIAVVVFVLAVPFPRRVSGDILVQPIAEFSIALNDFGLLESIHRIGGASPDKKSNFIQMMANEATALQILPYVKDGEEVNEGDTIAVLVSNQINQQIALAENELERLRDQLKLLKAPPKKERVAEAEAEVAAAKTNYEQLQRELKRVESLIAKGLTTQERLDAAQSATQIAKAEWNNKRSTLALVKSGPRPEEIAVLERSVSKQDTQIEYLRKQAAAQVIQSPIAGHVSLRPDDKRLITVTDNRFIEMAVPVSDFDIALVEMGQTVKIKLRSFPDRIFEGVVARIPGGAERIDNGSRFPVTVVVKNSEGEIKSGTSGYAKIEAGTATLASLGWRKIKSVLKVEFWSLW